MRFGEEDEADAASAGEMGSAAGLAAAEAPTQRGSAPAPAPPKLTQQQRRRYNKQQYSHQLPYKNSQVATVTETLEEPAAAAAEQAAAETTSAAEQAAAETHGVLACGATFTKRGNTILCRPDPSFWEDVSRDEGEDEEEALRAEWEK